MSKNKSILILLLIVGFIFVTQVSFAQETANLTIVFTGDARGEIENCHCPGKDFGGLERRAKYIEELGKEVGEILLLDVGDVLPLVTADFIKKKILYDAFISFKAMEIMGYDVMNVGESDLVLGEEFLKQKHSTLSFPFLSANIIDEVTNEPFFKPYEIKTMKNGLKVGILGIVNERYRINSDRLKITPHQEAALKYINEIRAQSDIVIVLAHLGLPYSIDLANKVPGIDVILSGHWDVEDEQPAKVGRTLIMSTSHRSRKVGRLDAVKEGDEYIYKYQSTELDAKYDGNKTLENLVSKMPKLMFRRDPEPQGFRASEEALRIQSMPPELPLRIMFFTSPDCRACMIIKKDLLPEIQEKYSNKIVIENYDIGIAENYEKMIGIEKLHGVKGGYAPEIFVSRYGLIGKEEIMSRLDEIIEEALKKKDRITSSPSNVTRESSLRGTPNEVRGTEAISKKRLLRPFGTRNDVNGPSLILSRFESFSIYAVLSAGLLDGINPCAFTTIVFFISFLAFVGYRRRQMLLAGLSFTLAVFITYLLIGLGIFNFLRGLDAFSYISAFLGIFIALFAFLLGVLSLLDYFRFKRTGDAKDIILKLPRFIRKRINSIIGTDFRHGEKVGKRHFLKIIWIALTAGFMVSVLESICTGQVYLPTIAFVFKMPGRKFSALLYLILYNLAFIVPLIVVLLLGIFGIRSNAFSRFMEKHLGLVKLATAILFFVLGVLLVILR